MQLDIDLVAYLRQWIVPKTTPIEQGKIAEDYASSPAIWVMRRPSSQALLLGGEASVAETVYDVEVYGVDVDAVQSMADKLCSPYTEGGLLNGFSGLMGSTWVLGAFVEDQADDYVSKVELATDAGAYAASFVLRVMH